MQHSLSEWVLFNGFVLAMLALDLGVFNRKAHVISFKEAVSWSLVWIAIAVAFGVGVGFWYGPTLSMEFFAGYTLEKALSVDNIFVILLIFTSFKVPSMYQHRVLFWGIIGALVMRGLFIWGGVSLIEKFHWIIYVFGLFLIATGIKMAVSDEKETDMTQSPIMKGLRKLIPVTTDYHGQSFFVTLNRRLTATPLFAVLVLVEVTDLIFAVDSIPAILAVSRDPFIVYTSNVFAILGLRSLYFALSGFVDRFYYLKHALSVILVFVGFKMLLSEVYKIPIHWSLGFIFSVLVAAVVASLIKSKSVSSQ